VKPLFFIYRTSEGSEIEEDSFFSTSAEASVGEEEDEVLFALLLFYQK
jgi:hypothetical protein